MKNLFASWYQNAAS